MFLLTSTSILANQEKGEACSEKPVWLMIKALNLTIMQEGAEALK